MSEQDEIHHMDIQMPYFDRVAASYPGLRRWIDIQRGHGGMNVFVFDRDISEVGPAYIFLLADAIFEYMLTIEPHAEGRITPGFSAMEYLSMMTTGDLPMGSRPEWGKPKDEPVTP